MALGNKVIQLRPSRDIPETLRIIADQIDNGEIDGENATLIIGEDVFQLGSPNDDAAAEQAIFNMTYGKAKLMILAIKQLGYL